MQKKVIVPAMSVVCINNFRLPTGFALFQLNGLRFIFSRLSRTNARMKMNTSSKMNAAKRIGVRTGNPFPTRIAATNAPIIPIPFPKIWKIA